MGHFSFVCPHCTRPILDHQSTWKGLNTWMSQAVVLKSNGACHIGEYDGYGRVDEADVMESSDSDLAVWAHRACWQHAGAPAYKTYDKPSRGCQHDGFNEQDLIPEPGTTVDEDAWAQALSDRRLRLRKIHVTHSRRFCDGNYENSYGKRLTHPWSRRFAVRQETDGTWCWMDYYPEFQGTDNVFEGHTSTEAGAIEACETRWTLWLQSQEWAALNAEAEQLGMDADGFCRENEE